MAAVQCFLLVLFAGALRPAFCQCDNTSLVLREGNGEIRSPNYPPNEYEKSASCSWEFQPSTDGKNYSLSLTIVHQRLYFVVGPRGDKDCSGNYSLFINNDKQDCQRYIAIHNPKYVTLMFYDSGSCDAGPPHQPFSPGVTVRYTSEGLLSSSNQFSMGFKILYKFTECIEATTLHPTTIVPTTTVIETTTVEETTTYMMGTTAPEKQETTYPRTQTTTKVTEKLTTSQGTTTKTDDGITGSNDGQLSTTTVLFLVSIPGFIGIIILIASAIIYCRGRNKSSAKPFFNKEEMDMKKLRNEEDKPGRESGEGDKLQTNTTAQSTEADTSALYSTIVKHTGDGAKEPIEI